MMRVPPNLIGAVSAGDAATVRSIGHDLKASFGQTGAARLQAMAIELETMGGQGQLSEAAEIVSSMASVFTALKERIQEEG